MTEENKCMQLVIPGAVNMTTDIGPYSQAEAERLRKEERQIDGVMFIDKLEQDKIIKEEVPKYEKAKKQYEALSAKLNARAKKLVMAMKKSDKTADVKDTLSDDFGMAVNFTAEFVGIDLEVEDNNTITYKWLQREVGDTYGGIEGDERTLDLPEDMKPMLAKYWEARKEAKRANDAVVEAQDKLFNRANRAADARGAHAIINMTEAEREEVKRLREAVKNGVTVEKLLTAGKK